MKKLAIITAIIAITLISLSGTSGKRHNSPIDSPIMVEDWMTSPFIDSIEEPLMVEDWMTKPFITFNS